jgi:hypothetical protein
MHARMKPSGSVLFIKRSKSMRLITQDCDVYGGDWQQQRRVQGQKHVQGMTCSQVLSITSPAGKHSFPVSHSGVMGKQGALSGPGKEGGFPFIQMPMMVEPQDAQH